MPHDQLETRWRSLDEQIKSWWDADIRRAVELRGIGIDQHLLNAGRRRNEDCDVAVIVVVV